MTDEDDVGAILDHVVCADCRLAAYRLPVGGPPDPDRHGNRRWSIKCVNPGCDNTGSLVTNIRHPHVIEGPFGLVDDDD